MYKFKDNINFNDPGNVQSIDDLVSFIEQHNNRCKKNDEHAYVTISEVSENGEILAEKELTFPFDALPEEVLADFYHVKQGSSFINKVKSLMSQKPPKNQVIAETPNPSISEQENRLLPEEETVEPSREVVNVVPDISDNTQEDDEIISNLSDRADRDLQPDLVTDPRGLAHTKEEVKVYDISNLSNSSKFNPSEHIDTDADQDSLPEAVDAFEVTNTGLESEVPISVNEVDDFDNFKTELEAEFHSKIKGVIAEQEVVITEKYNEFKRFTPKDFDELDQARHLLDELLDLKQKLINSIKKVWS